MIRPKRRPLVDGIFRRGDRARTSFPDPLEHGFSVITDPANWPSYWPGLVRVEPDTRWSAPGDRAHLVIRLLGRDVELRDHTTARTEAA